MSVIVKLFAGAFSHRNPQVVPSFSGGYTAAEDLDLYYSALIETRPYVIAMREVAADQGRSC